MNADLERAYSPSSMVGGDATPFIDRYVRRSNEAIAALAGRIVVLGGSLFVEARHGAPLVVFVHGGYWQALSATASMYPARPLLAAGHSFAAVEYTIAPEATVEEMVAEVQAALTELAEQHPGPVTVVGHSAGAHLVAMATLVHRSPLPIDTISLVSGVYDLRPLLETTVNAPLGLDLHRATALSPLLLPVTADEGQRVIVTCGEIETDEFKRQSKEYAERLAAFGCTVDWSEPAGLNHFDIIEHTLSA